MSIFVEIDMIDMGAIPAAKRSASRYAADIARSRDHQP